MASGARTVRNRGESDVEAKKGGCVLVVGGGGYRSSGEGCPSASIRPSQQLTDRDERLVDSCSISTVSLTGDDDDHGDDELMQRWKLFSCPSSYLDERPRLFRSRCW